MSQRLVIYCDICGIDKDVTGINHSIRTQVGIGNQAINGVSFILILRIENTKVPELCKGCSEKILVRAARNILSVNDIVEDIK